MSDGKVRDPVFSREREWVSASPGIDQEKIQRAVVMILEAVGENPDREGLRDTPARVARMYAEVFRGLHQNAADVLATRFHVDHNDVVLVKEIPFYSMCEHHLLPFFGHAHVAYVPSRGVVTGLSKLARLVEAFARRPQVQERMTNQIADTLHNALTPEGTLVLVEAEHLCMSMRGIQKPGTRTLTLATRGSLEANRVLREEVIKMVREG
ncbi:MAG: GTP cyclohydrolase I FolE [Firmicutes bacterium]|nr:GTP cyclohydrolase I FolE [Bacillota bacterium]